MDIEPSEQTGCMCENQAYASNKEIQQTAAAMCAKAAA